MKIDEEEKIRKIIKLHYRGMSAAQIARQVSDTTRNQIIAYLAILGLSRNGATYPEALNSLFLSDGNAISSPDLWNARVLKPKGWASLDVGCRWPIGDPLSDDFAFCGEPTEAGMPYCTHHCHVAFEEPNARRKRRQVT